MNPLPLIALLALAAALAMIGHHITRTHRPGAGDYYKAAAFIETEENSK